MFAMCGAVAALFLSIGNVSAQNGGGGGGGGGGFGGGGGGGGFRNMDPAQRQQFMLNRIKDNLGFTNDTDWNAVQPLVQKVVDAQTAARSNMGGMFRNRRNNNNGDNGGGNGGGNNGGGRGGFFGTPSPEAQALQSALDNNAPDAQVKDLLAKYQASQKAKQDALKQAQENLRAVLTPRQEAEASLMGLVD